MSESVSRRQLLQGAAGTAAAGIVGVAPAQAAPMPIKIANASGALTQVMGALMKQQRIMESFDLAPDILEVADGSKILGAVISGTVDVCLMSGFGQLFPAVERGGGLKVIGGALLSPTIAMFTGKSNVNSLKDLEGRTVGIGSVGALAHQLILTLLRKHHVDDSKVTFVNIGSTAAIFRAVSAGAIDAGPGEAALVSAAAQYHVRAIPGGIMAAELPDFTYQGSWASDNAIRTKREVLVRALAAQASLYRFIQSPQAKEPFIRARRSVFPTASQADHEADWNYVQTYKPLAVNLALTPQRIQYMQQLNVGFKVQKSVLPFDRVADMSLAADALKLLK
jgi:ABC-type nitrate/sulfonate/bicarbonate transport system substrate-binding protein